MIAHRKAPASVVYEDDEVIAFLDINPIQRGHTLVIPKKHFVDIWDIEPAALTKVVTVTKHIAENMAAKLNAQGINTFSASGKSAGQEIYHFHMHVIPLEPGESTKFREWWLSKTKKAQRSQLDELALELRI